MGARTSLLESSCPPTTILERSSRVLMVIVLVRVYYSAGVERGLRSKVCGDSATLENPTDLDPPRPLTADFLLFQIEPSMNIQGAR